MLWRAVLTAAPAGAVIWLLANIYVNGTSLANLSADALAPLGRAIGLDGVILLAYVIAIPANEIVVPTMLMVYMGTGMMTELDSMSELRTLLVDRHGWTMLTAVNLMLFSLLHNPCATTIMTIYKETLSALGHARRADAAGRRLHRDLCHGNDRTPVRMGGLILDVANARPRDQPE